MDINLETLHKADTIKLNKLLKWEMQKILLFTNMLQHPKDLLIGVLVAYVVIDLLMAYAVRSRHPGVVEVFERAMRDENVLVVVVLGIASGLLAYYLARRSREMFTYTPKKDE